MIKAIIAVVLTATFTAPSNAGPHEPLHHVFIKIDREAVNGAAPQTQGQPTKQPERRKLARKHDHPQQQGARKPALLQTNLLALGPGLSPMGPSTMGSVMGGGGDTARIRR